MNDFYVYAHIDSSGKPFYIGKGRGRRAWSKVGRNEEWLRCNEVGKQVVFLYEGLTKEDALALEAFQIALWGRRDLGTGCLVNQTDGREGGGGVKFTDERKRHISEAIKRSWNNPAVREARLIHLNKMNNDPEHTRHRVAAFTSAESRKKAGKSLSAYLQTEEGKRKRSEAMRKAYKNRKKTEPTPLDN